MLATAATRAGGPAAYDNVAVEPKREKLSRRGKRVRLWATVRSGALPRLVESLPLQPSA